MDILTWTPGYLLQNETFCNEYLENTDNWKKVPSLNSYNLHELKDNHLVRFRGMVQDMYNPEYFFEKFEVLNEEKNEKYVKNGKYQDGSALLENETIILESNNNVTSARQTFVLISLPGLNTWVDDIEKISRVLLQNEPKPDETKKACKRALDEDMVVDENITSEIPTENKIEKKKQCVSTKDLTTRNCVSREHILNFPLPQENGKCCHIKIYNETESLKLNEMIDVIGFISLDPVLSDLSYHNNEEDNEMEIQTHNPPPSLVPRIHCIAFRKIEDCNPLDTILPQSENIINLKKDLLLVLTQLLFGDTLTAEYLLCHLVSKVYLRKDLLALGKFALNISNIPATQYPSYGEQLYEILQLLIPKSHYLPMTLDNMNTLSFIPKKDYECNRLTSGVLQLSSNTHLVLDETRLQPGKLNDSGCKGIAALASTIKTQKVNYDFNYYQMEYECDIPILVLSEGKSLLPSDIHVPLELDDHSLQTFPEIFEASKHFLKPELLNNLRVYVSRVKHGVYELPNNTMELIQNEFVKMRQNGDVTGDDLHQLLVLARLICLSSGKSSLDEECWFKACDMEAKRKERLTKNEK